MSCIIGGRSTSIAPNYIKKSLCSVASRSFLRQFSVSKNMSDKILAVSYETGQGSCYGGYKCKERELFIPSMNLILGEGDVFASDKEANYIAVRVNESEMMKVETSKKTIRVSKKSVEKIQRIWNQENELDKMIVQLECLKMDLENERSDIFNSFFADNQ